MEHGRLARAPLPQPNTWNMPLPTYTTVWHKEGDIFVAERTETGTVS
jgi:hypothetical protein